MVPTPLVYFATVLTGCGTGVAVTGSHNPPEYNVLPSFFFSSERAAVRLSLADLQ